MCCLPCADVLYVTYIMQASSYLTEHVCYTLVRVITCGCQFDAPQLASFVTCDF